MEKFLDMILKPILHEYGIFSPMEFVQVLQGAPADLAEFVLKDLQRITSAACAVRVSSALDRTHRE